VLSLSFTPMHQLMIRSNVSILSKYFEIVKSLQVKGLNLVERKGAVACVHGDFHI
jgi:hypothetical protein